MNDHDDQVSPPGVPAAEAQAAHASPAVAEAAAARKARIRASTQRMIVAHHETLRKLAL